MLTRPSRTQGMRLSVLRQIILITASFSTAIGLRVKDGVVLAVEKLIHSKLLVPGANRRIQTVDRHIGMVYP